MKSALFVGIKQNRIEFNSGILVVGIIFAAVVQSHRLITFPAIRSLSGAVLFGYLIAIS
ncbi:uncharacterized protein CANTADRAFT_143499 [Suhomyces tanzawaensis NRRL Y-17324]|uniref:Uncharacterized protein n=1 Tax=Suhomyces tanzawaensis NRRL Y-17324 TaxID=984487 RepID=A0A1E4SS95_9ASCO|nr:uncharacterized protein CANTADRAFT_143499 [Suhomyces tanzawaensis NRRL Y-17324]ODV82386.1 hypothetical protein CANTADRAFT_143499 [Suhomyces tanzawaensis NRRL Y-17324]